MGRDAPRNFYSRIGTWIMRIKDLIRPDGEIVVTAPDLSSGDQ
jgi:hypothetical protein